MEENQMQLVSDAVDYKGNSADRTASGGWVAAALILGVELSERLSTMAIVVNLVTYLVSTMHLPSATSSNDLLGLSQAFQDLGQTNLIRMMRRKSCKWRVSSTFSLIINIGTLLAVTVLVYIQDKVGRSWGYGICSAAMFLAAFIFLSGTKTYRYKESPGSPMVEILQVLVAAVRKRNVDFPSDISHLYEDPAQELRLSHTNKLRCLDKAAVITSKDTGTSESPTPNPWSLCLVTNDQLLSPASFNNGEIHRRSFEIPPASFNVFMIGSIMLILAIYDRLLMPLFRKTRKPQGLTNLQKIGIGLFFSIIAMVAAAIAEMKRLSVAKTNGTTTSILPVSGFLLLPQFILVGIGDGLIYSGQLNFFITESPKGMKAIGTGLFLTTISLGLFGSSILVDIVRKVTKTKGGHAWLARRINDGRLDYFYGLLAVLSLINLGLFLVCARRYKPNPGEVALKDKN
ncbi:hypothetical protein CRYUN_Cryun26dG0077800 [Craigia yunnanensis]